MIGFRGCSRCGMFTRPAPSDYRVCSECGFPYERGERIADIFPSGQGVHYGDVPIDGRTVFMIDARDAEPIYYRRYSNGVPTGAVYMSDRETIRRRMGVDPPLDMKGVLEYGLDDDVIRMTRDDALITSLARRPLDNGHRRRR